MVSGGYSLRRKEFKRYTVFVIWFQVGTAWSGVTVNLLIQKCSTPSKSHWVCNGNSVKNPQWACL